MNLKRPVVVITFADGIEGDHLQLLKDEKTSLENTLWDLHAKELIEIYKEESLSRQELIELLPRFEHNRIILFHYAGHAGSSGIHTEGGESRAEGVAALLGHESALNLVVLNGCSSKEQVKGLKENGVKAIIATSAPIGDEAATNFATTFYKRLVTGYTLKEAFNYAIAAVKTEKSLDSSIISMRSIEFDTVPEQLDTVPWDLYYDEKHPEILEWKLPSPADPKEHIDPDIYKDPEELQAMSFAEKKGHLLKVLENDLNRIIPDLDALISSESEHRESLRLLHGQLNDYFRNKYSGAVSKENLETDKKRIKLSLNHMISMLEAKDFAPKVQATPRKDTVQAPVENMKKGGIWRKIPPKMQVNTPTECKIKIAVDKSQLKQERASSDIKIRIDTIRTTNEMEVDLFEPPLGDGPYFDIKFMGSKSQLVDIKEPTEWTFYVTPLKEGNCKLLLHVTIVEEGSNKQLVKVIPFEEVLEVVSYKPEELGVYEKVAILNYLPFGALIPAGQIEPEAEQQPGQEPATSEAATASTSTAASASAGLGIGKILLGIVAIAALAGLAWWGLQGGTEGGDTPETESVQEAEAPPATQEEAGPEQAVSDETPSEQDQEPPSLANRDLSYDMMVEDDLVVPFEKLVEGAYLPSYTFSITEGETSDKLNIATDANAVNLTALQEGKHTIQFQICLDQEPCSQGNIEINIKAKAVASEEVEEVAPTAPAFEYGTVKGQAQSYNTVKIADTWWTKQNLNEQHGLCQGYDENNCAKYGSLYIWPMAEEACKSLSPGTWTLPTMDDWNNIKNSAANRKELNLLKGGYMLNDTSKFMGTLGRFWMDQPQTAIELANNNLTFIGIPGDEMLSCLCVRKE